MLQLATFGITLDFASALIPNFLTEILGIFVTLLVVERLFEYYRKKEEKSMMNQVVGNQLKAFVSKITTGYIHYVTKNPNSANLDEIINSISKYVTRDFFKQPVKVIQINPADLFKPIEKLIDYQVFCEHFKENISKQITEFLGRFITVLPKDIRYSIFKISDLLHDNMLITTLQYGFALDMNRVDIDHEHLQTVLKEIGEEIRTLNKLSQES